MKRTKLVMQQILIAPWEGGSGLTYSTLGLDSKGGVWRFDQKCGGWVAYNMLQVDPNVRDGHRR